MHVDSIISQLQLLKVQLLVTLLYLFSTMVLLKPVHEVRLWPKIMCIVV